MFHPTRGLDVDFSASDPFHIPDLHTGIIEIGTSVRIAGTGMKNLDWVTGSSSQLMFVKILELP
jgi:hypothetical protein